MEEALTSLNRVERALEEVLRLLHERRGGEVTVDVVLGGGEAGEEVIDLERPLRPEGVEQPPESEEVDPPLPVSP